MTRAEILARDIVRLKPVHPQLRGYIEKILFAMDGLGFPMTVTAGARTTVQQMALWQKGRRFDPVAKLWVPINPVTRTGIVTNADGTTRLSNHQITNDGWGYAVDCAFLIDGPDHDDELDTPSWDESHPWALYGEMGEALGGSAILWGGRWKTLRDLPHLELRR